MGRLLMCLIMLYMAMPAIGQTPKYKTAYTPLTSGSAGWDNKTDSVHGTRIQVLFYPNDFFPPAPPGNMTNVYFRYARHSSPAPVPTIYYSLTVKMKHTDRMSWKGRGMLDTF